MKAIFFVACMLLAVTGYRPWGESARDLAGWLRQQLPTQMAALVPGEAANAPPTTPGHERQIAARLSNTLQQLQQTGQLNDARLRLQNVRFVPFEQTTLTPNNYATRLPDSRPRQRPSATFKQNTSSNSTAELDDIVTELRGFYAATIYYDIISPLTMEAGVTLLTAACACGVAQIQLNDGFGMAKSFDCPKL